MRGKRPSPARRLERVTPRRGGEPVSFRSLRAASTMELRTRFPFRPPIVVRDAQADVEEELRVFRRPGEVPVVADDVLRRVIELRDVVLSLLLSELGRLAEIVRA